MRGESVKNNSGINVSLNSPKLFCSKSLCLYLHFKFSYPVVCFMCEMSS